MIPQFIASAVTIFIILNVILGACAYLIFLERKVAAWTQDRIGPNRVNFSFGILPFKGKQFGLGQALVDGVKLLLKEDYTPPGVDHALFLLAPVLAVVVAMLGWAVIPWGGYLDWHGTQLAICAVPINLGVIYILARGSLGGYGGGVGGNASNNKYSFLGALRATAQMLSYEIPMGLGVLIIILMTGTARAETLVEFQALRSPSHGWNIFYQPLLAIIVFTAILAECNRAPFDLAEAEQELVGGYHTEYSSMKWALFFLGEYMHMITGCAFFALLFLGGWDVVPFAGLMPLVASPATAGEHVGCLGFGSRQVRHLCRQSDRPALRDDVGALDFAAFPIRSTHAAGLARHDSHEPGPAVDHRHSGLLACLALVLHRGQPGCSLGNHDRRSTDPQRPAGQPQSPPRRLAIQPDCLTHDWLMSGQRPDAKQSINPRLLPRAGTPTTVAPSATSSTTAAPAPIVQSCPILIPGRTHAPIPTSVSDPTRTFPAKAALGPIWANAPISL